MIASVIDFLTAFFESLIASGAFKTFANLLLSIAVMYCCIWLVVGGMKVASGQQRATELFLNLGKFVLAFIIIFYVANGNYVRGVLELTKDNITKLSKTGDDIIGAFEEPLEQFQMQLSMSTVKAKKDNGLFYNSVTEKSIAQTVEDFKNDIREKDEQAVKNSLDELRRAKQRRVEYCNKQNITSNCPTAHYDELIKMAQERQAFLSSAKYKEQLEESGKKLNAVLLTKDKMNIAEALGLFLGELFAIVLCAIFFVLCVIFVLPFWFKIFEYALTYAVSLCLLIATIPIAAVCLIYGKWFKDIFRAWFNRALSNFIQIPIFTAIIAFLVNGVDAFPPVFGVSLPAGFMEIIKGAVLGPENNMFDVNFLFRVGCVLFLYVFMKIAIHLLEVVQKFLDDLVGNGFNAVGSAASKFFENKAGFVAGGMVGAAGSAAIGAARTAAAVGVKGADALTFGAVSKTGNLINRGAGALSGGLSSVSKFNQRTLGNFTGANARAAAKEKEALTREIETEMKKEALKKAMQNK